MPDADSNPTPERKPHGSSIIAAGLLLLALALVVLYTSRPAFSSPLAMVVVAAIGLAALLFQLRLRKDLHGAIHAPLWLNILGLVFAIAAMAVDAMHLASSLMLVAALGSVLCFAISGISVLHALRRRNNKV